MRFETAKSIAEEIFLAIDTELKTELLENAVKYTLLRTEWYFSDTERRKEIDFARTAAHNSFIDSCNILSRSLIAKGKNADWRKELGNDRKTLGDFACYLTCIIGLKAG